METTAAEEEDENHMENEMADKLDILMEILFDHIQDVTHINGEIFLKDFCLLKKAASLGSCSSKGSSFNSSHLTPLDKNCNTLPSSTPQPCHVNPLSPDIKMHILLAVLRTFLMELVTRICLNIKMYHPW